MALAAVVVAGVALLFTASFFTFRWIGRELREGSPGRVHAFREGFDRTCRKQCAAAGEARGCDEYCRCRYEHMRAGRSEEQFMQWALAQVGDAGPSGELTTAGDRADLQCGGRLLESGFREGCTSACVRKGGSRERCARYCACTFETLRAGKTKEAADRWWLENLAREPFTAQGQRAFDRAVDHCSQWTAGEVNTDAGR